MRKLAAVLVLQVLAVTSCIVPFGDASRTVEIVNATDVSVDVGISGRNPDRAYKLAPGEAVLTDLLWPLSEKDERTRRIEARDSSGRVVFCTVLGYRDLRRIDWRVAIRSDGSVCP